MSTLQLERLKQVLTEQNVLISFSGPFSHSVIEELGKAMRNYLEEEQVPRSSLMDLFSVFIEQSQNVRDYTAPRGEAENSRLLQSGIVVISRDGNRYSVSSGNLIRHADTGPLRARIEHLRGLDAAGLRALYKETMRKPIAPGQGSGGAGLGLISMARTATQPLEYSITPVDDEYAFFSLRVEI